MMCAGIKQTCCLSLLLCPLASSPFHLHLAFSPHHAQSSSQSAFDVDGQTTFDEILACALIFPQHKAKHGRTPPLQAQGRAVPGHPPLLSPFRRSRRRRCSLRPGLRHPPLRLIQGGRIGYPRQVSFYACIFAGIGLLHDRNEISRITGDERKSKPLLDAPIAKEQYHQSRSTRQRGRARGVLSTDKQKAICIFGLEFSVEAHLVLVPQFAPNRCTTGEKANQIRVATH